MNDKIRNILKQIIDKFESGNIPEAVAYSMFQVMDVPSAKWSLFNRILQFFAGTADGRGYQQWKTANRSIKKGAKAFYILVPYIKKEENEETGEEETTLKGFMTCPVFRVEDTEGEPLDYEKIELPDLPLLERAKEWGISVKAIPGDYRYYGYFSPVRQEICLATREEMVFFHELAHAAHFRVKGGLKSGQDPFREIVAELSALSLAFLVGKDGRRHIGNSYQYIADYAVKLKVLPYTACLKVMSDVEKVLNLITGGKENGS